VFKNAFRAYSSSVINSLWTFCWYTVSESNGSNWISSSRFMGEGGSRFITSIVSRCREGSRFKTSTGAYGSKYSLYATVSSSDKSMTGTSRSGRLRGAKLSLERRTVGSVIGCAIGMMRVIDLKVAPCTNDSVISWSRCSRNKACLMRSFFFLPARWRFFFTVCGVGLILD